MLPYKKLLPFLLILLAFAVRVWQLTAVPPGLTHDEAAHGHDAAYILKGVTLIYFTVGYGREPLFDYWNAGLIAALGANPFTLRFSAVVFGMLTLAVTHRVARTLFGWETATLALALMGASFWPLATSRQILRSDMLPFEIALAVVLFLKLNAKDAQKKKGYWLLVIGLSLTLAASLYTYIPARILWLIFPLTLLSHYASRIIKSKIQNLKSKIPNLHASRLISISIATLLAFALASPLFYYLSQHPEAEQRIGMLAQPLTGLQTGNLSPILDNAKEFLLAFFLPTHGDHFLAYNIPGQPIFDPITAFLFLTGLTLLLTPSPLLPRSLAPPLPRSLAPPLPRSPAPPLSRPLLFFWLALGLAPSLITGPEALTTRIIGAQPVLYIVAAVGLMHLLNLAHSLKITEQQFRFWKLGFWDFGILGFGLASLSIATFQNYFITWAQSPDVRAAYQSTLIEMLKSVNGPTVISSVYPGMAHDPYIGELITKQETRWVDGRFAIIGSSKTQFQYFAPSSSSLHPFFVRGLNKIGTTLLRPDDLDSYFDIYSPIERQTDATQKNNSIGIFNNAIELYDCGWQKDFYSIGKSVELFCFWRVLDANLLGLLHPPAFKTDLNLFTHVLNPDGSIFLQQDRLDAPSWDWQTGDTIIQIHQFAIPAEVTPGEYQVEVGLYDRVTGERLMTQGGADHIVVAPLIIKNNP